MTKQVFLLLSLVFIAGSFCAGQKSINGNGNVTTKEYQVDPFNKIDLSGVFNVTMVQGTKEKVVVEADENLQEHILVSSQGNRLVVKMRDKVNINRSKKLQITISLKEISELKLAIVGNLESEMLKLKELEINSSSVGNIRLNLDATKLDADFHAVGNIQLSGNITNARINNSSVGKLEAFDLVVQNLTIENSSVGKTEVFAAKELNIKATGIGNLYYKGDAVVRDMDISGLGKVKKM